MKLAWITVAVFAACLSTSAVRLALPPADVEAAAKAELLALHQDARRAHFAHDVDALVAGLPHTFTYVRDGRVEMQSKESLRQRFTEYFRDAEFTAWDNLEPPIVHVSPDGQMGWMIVRMKIAYIKTDAVGKKTSERTVMAWMSAYEKRDGKWLHVANTTTIEPQ